MVFVTMSFRPPFSVIHLTYPDKRQRNCNHTDAKIQESKTVLDLLSPMLVDYAAATPGSSVKNPNQNYKEIQGQNV